MDIKIRELLLQNYSLEKIQNILDLNDESFDKYLKELLLNLNNDKILLENLIKRNDIAVGRIDISRDGIGYINFGDKRYSISESNLNSALNGDIVLATQIDVARGKKVPSEVTKIIKRKDGLVVVNYIDGKFIPLDVVFNYDIELSEEDKEKIKDNDRIIVKVNDTKSGLVTAELQEVIGHKDDIALDENTVAFEHGFHKRWTPAIERELEDTPDKVIEEDVKGRVDLRKKKAFTIDDIDTQDMDDALIYERLPNGHHLVFIPVSHISCYVKRNGAIYTEALERGTSLYLGKHSLPMFPRKLCNGIGSLNPNEDRLTRSVMVEFDENYNIVNYDIINSVIRSRKKMNYDDVEKIITRDIIPEGYEDFYTELVELNKINEALEKRKMDRGALNFYGNDLKVLFDSGMKPVGFKAIRQNSARKLIENFALLANELYDIRCIENEIKNINRVEEIPDKKKINTIITWIQAMGISVNEIHNINSQLELKTILNRLREDPRYPALSGILLRGMQKARFSTEEIGHYGLALKNYAQFTSPIRRIGDFINHSIQDDLDKGIKHYYSDEELEDISIHASFQEKEADRATQDINRIYMAQYMKNHIGEQFKGTIIDIGNYGVLVKTDNEVIGRVNYKDIRNGKYRLDKEGNFLFDQARGTEYYIGDDVEITVKDAIPEKRIIDFYLNGPLEKKKTLKKHINKYRR